jgi:adenylate cyclase
VRRTLESYVSADVVREVLDNPASYLNALGGTRAHVVVLMTDLRGFTTISESLDSNQLVTQLNEYLAAMVDDIFALRGSIDKFIGDAILAVWGHLNSSGAREDATRAVQAFFRMRESLQRLNSDWTARGMPTLSMGCGINFGEVVFGNIGSARKKEITVIGDAVNVAARLEGLTKHYDRDLLLGEAAADLVRDSYALQFIDRVAVKGKSKPLDIYSVIGGKNDPRAAAMTAYLDSYERAIVAYRAADFDRAGVLFRECGLHVPDDTLARMYTGRCAEFSANPPREWSGIYVATTK